MNYKIDLPFLVWSFLKARRSSTSCFQSFLMTLPLPHASVSQRTLLSSSGHCSVRVATILRKFSCWSLFRLKSNFWYFVKLLRAAFRSRLTLPWRSFTTVWKASILSIFMVNQWYYSCVTIGSKTAKLFRFSWVFWTWIYYNQTSARWIVNNAIQ